MVISRFMFFDRKKQKIAILLLISTISFVGLTPASAEEKARQISADALQHLNQDKFAEISSTREFPEGVKSYYKNLTGKEINAVFADPGADWQSGCSRTPNGPPARSFIVGAKSATLCVLYYQLGGFALVDTAELFELKGKDADKVWSSSMFRDHPRNMNELLQAVRSRIKSK